MVLTKRWSALLAALLAVSSACSEDLNIVNPNNPDVERATQSPEDVVQLAVSSVNTWYLGSTYYRPFAMLQVTSDNLTANFGNFGMRFNNVEPRIAYNNSTAADDGLAVSNYWENMYGALGTANDALRAFAAGVKLPNDDAGTEAAKHLAMFSQAAVMTNLALSFDSAFVVDEATDVAANPPQLQHHTAVRDAAVVKWDALIAATAGKSHVYGVETLPLQGGVLTSQRLNRIANTYAALTLAYAGRTPAEAGAANWARIAAYADKGIGTGSAGAPFDFTIVGDNDQWYSYLLLYGDYPAWMRVDMRIINMIDPSKPAKYEGRVTFWGKAAGDARVNTDLRWMGSATERAEIAAPARDSVVGDPARGIWMMSPYQHKRYEHHSWHKATFATGPAPYILAAESDLVRAEALARSGGAGGLVTAADLINTTRVGRGQRTPATAADGQAGLLAHIYYERDLELMVTNGWDLFRNRIAGRLQAGTLRHLPVPAKELEILNKPVYSYGSAGKEM